MSNNRPILALYEKLKPHYKDMHPATRDIYDLMRFWDYPGVYGSPKLSQKEYTKAAFEIWDKQAIQRYYEDENGECIQFELHDIFDHMSDPVKQAVREYLFQYISDVCQGCESFDTFIKHYVWFPYPGVLERFKTLEDVYDELDESYFYSKKPVDILE